MTQRTFVRAQVAAVLSMALLIALPYFLYTLHPEYRGLIPFRTNDDGFYMGRLDAVVSGRWSEFQNGITGPLPGEMAPARGVAPGLLELLGGILFSWTNLHGAQVSVILTTIVAPLTIPLVAALLRSFEVGRSLALAGSLLYTFVFLAPLQRPVYMSLALPVSLLGLLLVARLWKRPRALLIFLSAIVLGVLPSVYFWSFSFVWAAALFLFFLHLLLVPPSPEKNDCAKALLLTATVTLLVSSPFLFQALVHSLEYPFSSEVALRNQIVASRAVESPPRSILLALLAVLSLLSARTMRRDWMTLPLIVLPLALVLAAFTVMHQNLLHGLRFTFASHYYPSVCLAALSMGCFALQKRLPLFLKTGIVSIASLFLLAGAWDYRVAWTLLKAPGAHLDLQHLAPALALLEDGRRETVLTDYRSAQMVTNWTDDDVVFTPYVRHLLVSNEEFVERYCLSEFPNPAGPDIRWIAAEAVHRYARHLLPAREREFGTACRRLLGNPKAALEQYGVDLLLWNERERPTWQVPPEFFEKVYEGGEWSLWRDRFP